MTLPPRLAALALLLGSAAAGAVALKTVPPALDPSKAYILVE